MNKKHPEVDAFISVGSSIEPEKNIEAALAELCETISVKAVSSVYRTAAISRPGAPDFLNCVFLARTDIPPLRLKLEVLAGIERRLGRERHGDKYGPREIDLDLLLYGSETFDEDNLKLPHPDISRWFVRAGLLELSPALKLPDWSGQAASSGPAGTKPASAAPLTDFTNLLRRRIAP